MPYNGLNACRRVGHQHRQRHRRGSRSRRRRPGHDRAGRDRHLHVVLNTQPTADVTIGLSSNDHARAPSARRPDVHRGQLEHAADRHGDRRPGRRRRRQRRLQHRQCGRQAPIRSTRALDPNDVSATNTDDDTAGITVTPTSGLVTTEVGGTPPVHRGADSRSRRRTSRSS